MIEYQKALAVIPKRADFVVPVEDAISVGSKIKILKPDANCFIIVDEETSYIKKGDKILIQLI